MEGLVERLIALEQRDSTTGGVGRDFRVILMHIARAEETVLRIERSSSWTRSNVGLLMTEDS